VLETKRIHASVRKLLASLDKLKRSRDFIVFLLQDQRPSRSVASVDGFLIKGRGVAAQLEAALDALQAAGKFRRKRSESRQQLKRFKTELGRLRNLVVRDDLTCLYNLRFFDRSLGTEHSRAIRFGRDYSLIFMDLDGLRDVNTRFGHLAGGQVLRQLGEYLNTSLRRIDIPARVGGDEFVVICPETNKLAARILAERLRQGIEDLRLHEDENYPGITASMGVASFPEDGDRAEKILERADQALYQAKAHGKNNVFCWGDPPAVSSPHKLGGSVHKKPLEEEPEKEETETESVPSK
jgi:diguanylate cyclase (GGDEF)-like protein